jgi:peptidoglycan/LPS O-acetylase OafA/YrhL
MKRLASLDLARGIAILCMVIFHVWYYLDDKTSTLPENGNYIMMMMALIFWVFGYWRSFFLFVSAIVVTYSIQKNLMAGKRREVILVKNLFGGLIMYLFAIFRETIVSPEGFLGQSYVARSWTGNFSMVYLFDTLHMIGLSMMVIGILQYVLSFKDGHSKWKRNSLIYIILAVIVVSVSPLVHYGVNYYFGLPLDFTANHYGELAQFTPSSILASFGRLFWSSLAGWE